MRLISREANDASKAGKSAWNRPPEPQEDPPETLTSASQPPAQTLSLATVAQTVRGCGTGIQPRGPCLHKHQIRHPSSTSFLPRGLGPCPAPSWWEERPEQAQGGPWLEGGVPCTPALTSLPHTHRGQTVRPAWTSSELSCAPLSQGTLTTHHVCSASLPRVNGEKSRDEHTGLSTAWQKVKSAEKTE